MAMNVGHFASSQVAVFGCNGYLGQHLVRYLLNEKGAEVTGFDIQNDYAGGDSIAYLKLDVTNLADIQRFEDGFDTIYYLTGLTGTDVSFERYEQFVKVNELGLLNMLDRLRGFNVIPKFVFPSTRLVYKGVQGVPLAEGAEKELKTIYASSKYNGEQYLEMYSNLFGLDYTVFRVCVPYANLMGGTLSYGTVGFFLDKAQKGEDISLFGDGMLRRTFTHVWDVCRQMVEVAALPESKRCTFNVDGEAFSLKEAAAFIAEKYSVGFKFIPWPDKSLKLESGDTIFDASRIRAIFPQTLTHSFEKWIHT